MTEDLASPTTPKSGSIARRSRSSMTQWLRLLAAYIIAHGVLLAVILLYSSPMAVATRIRVFDAAYYANIAAHGYPTTLPLVGGSTIALFCLDIHLS